MKPNILSWNLRGLNDEEKCLRIKNLQSVEGRCSMSKMEIMSYNIMCSL
jgi:hypothetical protein